MTRQIIKRKNDTLDTGDCSFKNGVKVYYMCAIDYKNFYRDREEGNLMEDAIDYRPVDVFQPSDDVFYKLISSMKLGELSFYRIRKSNLTM